MSWVNYLIAAGGILSAYGAIKSGSNAEEYYSQLASIEEQNAAIEMENARLAAREREARANWEYTAAGITKQRAAISYEAAGIDLENARYLTEYKVWEANQEALYNDYMAKLTRRQEAETIDIASHVYEGEKEFAEEREAIKKDEAQQSYDTKIDTLRHVIAETAAKGGKSGFNINAGSFMSALRDQTSIGDMYATGAKDIAFRSAELATDESLLSAETNYKQRMMAAEGLEGTAVRYDLAGKINLESAKLAEALYGLEEGKYGLAGQIYGLAEQGYGLAGQEYNFNIGQAKNIENLATQRYGINMQRAGITRQQGSNAKAGSYYAAGGALFGAAHSFGKAYYGR